MLDEKTLIDHASQFVSLKQRRIDLKKQIQSAEIDLKNVDIKIEELHKTLQKYVSVNQRFVLCKEQNVLIEWVKEGFVKVHAFNQRGQVIQET